ncbi:hypothetical protein E3N88_12879 [Mikania micrantha]|uniref:Uncharacterized protein n=1 Tax=Mikania micrantha TaxID=192012 RepID=A0A5N6P6X7_9ASTR|nr:hypothetical protein E3N88_12879 [Mikania micrantha]
MGRQLCEFKNPNSISCNWYDVLDVRELTFTVDVMSNSIRVKGKKYEHFAQCYCPLLIETLSMLYLYQVVTFSQLPPSSLLSHEAEFSRYALSNKTIFILG